MFESIRRGERPTSVFRRLVAQDSALDNSALARLLVEEFPGVGTLGIQLIWHWKGPGKSQGLSDEDLDNRLIQILRDGGHLN